MTVACVMGKTVPPSTHNTKGKQNGVRALTSGPAVLTEQRTRQPHRFRRPLTDSTISALPLLRVAPAPRPQVLLLFSFSGSFLWWGSTPRKMLPLAVCSCRGGGVVSEGTGLPASSLLLRVRASTQVLHFTLKNPYYRGTQGRVPYTPASCRCWLPRLEAKI